MSFRFFFGKEKSGGFYHIFCTYFIPYKTTLGRTVIRLHEPTSGKILYKGEPIYDSEKKIAVDMKPYRGKMQLIFQDPSASLDPRMTVGESIGEALDIHNI